MSNLQYFMSVQDSEALGYTFNNTVLIPHKYIEILQNYISDGSVFETTVLEEIKQFNFITAVLAGNIYLIPNFEDKDIPDNIGENKMLLLFVALSTYVKKYFPPESYGNMNKVNAWINGGGLKDKFAILAKEQSSMSMLNKFGEDES